MLVLWGFMVLIATLKGKLAHPLWQWPKWVPIELKLIGILYLWTSYQKLYWEIHTAKSYQYFLNDLEGIVNWVIKLAFYMCLMTWYIVEGVGLYREGVWKGIKAQSFIIKHKQDFRNMAGAIYGVVGIDIRKREYLKIIGYTILHGIGLFVLIVESEWDFSEMSLLIIGVLVGIYTLVEWMSFESHKELVIKVAQIKEENKKIIFAEELVKLIGKVVLYSVSLLVIAIISYNEPLVALMIALILVLGMMLLSIRRIGSYRQLYDYVGEIAASKEAHQPPRSFLSPIVDELSKIDVSFKEAVSQEVISQRMKTELISNVSHDLKTPLTSIINYVDLLKNEDLTKEEQQEYVAILDQKSKRLKILIEDLFEASKTASGNIDLLKEKVDVVALLKQTMGELTEKITASGLKFKMNLPEEKIYCELDGRRTYRIFENLISNILNYAEPNSRVYIHCETKEEIVQITFRNISAYEMNFTAEEIMERFKRGDVSRNTEGSGLGLAIAKNLTELQGGKFELVIDGDLFKVMVRFRQEV